MMGKKIEAQWDMICWGKKDGEAEYELRSISQALISIHFKIINWLIIKYSEIHKSIT